MARNVKAKAKRKPKPRTDPKEVGAPVPVTNAQIRVAMFRADGDLAKAARALGISRSVLRLLLPEDAEPQSKPAKPDMSVADFDRACRQKREERQKRLEAREAADQEALYGHDADAVAFRGAIYDRDAPQKFVIDEGNNPDQPVAKAEELLERRTPANWAAMVVQAWVLLGDAVRILIRRPIVTQADVVRVEQALGAMRGELRVVGTEPEEFEDGE